MSGADFLDTNVLFYAYDEKSPEKQEIARQFLRSGTAGKTFISSQVLSEFSATMLHKASPAASLESLLKALDALSSLQLVMIDAEIVRRAVETRRSYRLPFYDCLIIAAAERAGCGRILSEDFNSGQTYFGITVVNPFVLPEAV
jgi:predicted nucleic acid-binding protein